MNDTRKKTYDTITYYVREAEILGAKAKREGKKRTDNPYEEGVQRNGWWYGYDKEGK